MTKESTSKTGTREKTLQMRVSDEEYEIIEGKAKELGLTTSNFMRLVCLHADINISLNRKE